MVLPVGMALAKAGIQGGIDAVSALRADGLDVRLAVGVFVALGLAVERDDFGDLASEVTDGLVGILVGVAGVPAQGVKLLGGGLQSVLLSGRLPGRWRVVVAAVVSRDALAGVSASDQLAIIRRVRRGCLRG